MKGKITHIIYGSLIGLLFILVGLSLAFAKADIDCDSLSFSLEKAGDIMGIFVSTIGLLITAYFVVLAINAYSYIKDIQNTKIAIDGYAQDVKEKVEDFQSQKNVLLGHIEDIQNQKNEINGYVQNVKENFKNIQNIKVALAQSQFYCLETQIVTADVSNLGKSRDILKLEQARLSYRYPMLDKGIRLPLLLILADIGEEKDINNIKTIIDNPDEDTEIKEYATVVLDELKKRLGID